jgi:hypothetical protein
LTACVASASSSADSTKVTSAIVELLPMSPMPQDLSGKWTQSLLLQHQERFTERVDQRRAHRVLLPANPLVLELSIGAPSDRMTRGEVRLGPGPSTVVR